MVSCKTTTVKEEEPEPTPVVEKVDPRTQTIENLSQDELREHMEALFNLIEEKIALGDYEGWSESISRKYIYYLNDPANLKKITEESDFLYNRNIILRNPADYFMHVVIKSREGKSLEFLDYEKINEFHVKVICLFDKKHKFVYDFIYEEGSWKLDR